MSEFRTNAKTNTSEPEYIWLYTLNNASKAVIYQVKGGQMKDEGPITFLTN